MVSTCLLWESDFISYPYTEVNLFLTFSSTIYQSIGMSELVSTTSGVDIAKQGFDIMFFDTCRSCGRKI